MVQSAEFIKIECRHQAVFQGFYIRLTDARKIVRWRKSGGLIGTGGVASAFSPKPQDLPPVSD